MSWIRRASILTPVLVLLMAVAACTESDPRCASLPGGGRYCLQPTSSTQPFDAQQKVEAVFNGQRETMIVELEVDAAGMRFAGLTPFGQKLLQASYDNLAVKADVLPDKRLDPALFMAFLQIALWPAESVRAGLGDSAVLEEREGQRRVLDNGRLVMQVGYTGGRLAPGDMHIVFPAAQMELDVTTLDIPGTK